MAQKSPFGELIEEVIKIINESNYRYRNMHPNSGIPKYTRAQLAHAANIKESLMSDYCSLDVDGLLPKRRPDLHTVMKIIAVLNCDKILGERILARCMMNISDVDAAPYVINYQYILNAESKNVVLKNDNIAATAWFNEYLLGAINNGMLTKGVAVIGYMFVNFSKESKIIEKSFKLST